MNGLVAVFGWVAKGTLVLAGLVLAGLAMVVLMAPAGAPDLPSTRKGWLSLLLAVAVLFALILAFLYFWPGLANPRAAGG